IGQGGQGVMRAAVAPADAPLERLPRAEELLDVLGKPGVIELVGDIDQRPPAVARDEIEDAGYGRSEAADDELAVEEDGGDLGAVIEVLRIGMGPGEHVAVDRQLVSDG